MHTDILLNVPGGKIFARRWQPAPLASDVPLILLHDSLGCVELWRDFPEALARRLGRPVVAYDRLGFGRSSQRKDRPASDFLNEEAETHFPAVRAALGITDFALFGHSIGGAMALVAASRAQNPCKAVVSESAPAFVEDRTLAGIRRSAALFQQPEQFERLTRWHGAKARWVLEAWTGIWLSPDFASWSLEPDLPLVRCPVLLIQGDEDEYGSARVPEFIRDHLGGPAEVHILSGCGHVPHRERPDEVTDLIAQFRPLSATPG